MAKTTTKPGSADDDDDHHHPGGSSTLRAASSKAASRAFANLCGGMARFNAKRFGNDMEKFQRRRNPRGHPDGGDDDGEEEEEDDDDDDDDDESKSRSNSDGDEEDEEKISMFATTTTTKRDDKRVSKSNGYHQTPEELANIARKKYRIKVKGDDSRNVIPTPLESFKDLETMYGCSASLVRRIEECKWLEPTPIQRQAIPMMLKDVETLAVAPTGSGKTLAFLLPIFMRLGKRKDGGVRAILLAPTKELATQSMRICTLLSDGLRVTQLSKATAANDFKKVDILVSTPLRLASLLMQKKISTHAVEFLVLDEADKLFEMGFVEQIDAIVHACDNPDDNDDDDDKKKKKKKKKKKSPAKKKKCLKALFSATLPETAERLARSVMHHCVRLTVGERNSANESISQKLVFCGKESGKILAVKQMVQKGVQTPLIIFTQSKDRCIQVAKELTGGALGEVGLIHSDMSDKKRKSIVDLFRIGKLNCLCATDLMARGMDFAAVGTVINFDFPITSTAYIHRIGRSGRAGRVGNAVTFFTEEDAKRGTVRSIARVMQRSGCDVPKWLLNLEADKNEKYKPMRKDGRENNPRRDRVDNKEGYLSREIRAGKKKLEHKKQRKAMFKEMKKAAAAAKSNDNEEARDDDDDYFPQDMQPPSTLKKKKKKNTNLLSTDDKSKKRRRNSAGNALSDDTRHDDDGVAVIKSKKKKKKKKKRHSL